MPTARSVSERSSEDLTADMLRDVYVAMENKLDDRYRRQSEHARTSTTLWLQWPSPLVTAKAVGPLRSLRRALRWVRAQLAVRPAVNRGVLGVLTPGHFRPPMGCIFTAAAGCSDLLLTVRTESNRSWLQRRQGSIDL